MKKLVLLLIVFYASISFSRGDEGGEIPWPFVEKHLAKLVVDIPEIEMQEDASVPVSELCYLPEMGKVRSIKPVETTCLVSDIDDASFCRVWKKQYVYCDAEGVAKEYRIPVRSRSYRLLGTTTVVVEDCQ